jgi:hypothetical protein
MANTWTLGTLTFAIDTSTNVAGLTTLKGSAPSALDTVNVTAGTLTIESALTIKDINTSGTGLFNVSTGSLVVAPATVTNAATTAQLVARVRNFFPESTADLWSTADEVLPALNEGVGMLFEDLPISPAAITPLNCDAIGSAIALPATLMRINKLWWDPTSVELTPHSTLEYERLDYAGRSTAGTPTGYIYDQPAADGSPQIFLVPPSESALTGCITGTAWSRPAALTLTGVNPTWRAEFHYIPCYWAAYVLLLKDNMPQRAADMLVRFEQEKARYRSWLNKRRPPGIEATQPVREADGATPRFLKYGWVVTP